MAVSVEKWETANGISVPVCQPNNSLFTVEDEHTDDFQCKYLHACLKDIKNQSARYCRKLFKNGYTCTIIKTTITSDESDLMSFLYYHIRLKSPKEPTKEQDFYFKRNVGITELSDSCYASDDHGIALLKMAGGKLHCCYIDLLTCKAQFQSLKVVPSKSVVYICKGSVWIIQKSVNHMSDNYLMRFCGDTPFVQRVDYHFPSVTSEQYNFVENLSISQIAVMFNGHQTFIFFNISEMSVYRKDLPDELFSKASVNMVVGNLCLLQATDLPKLYILTLVPDIRLQKLIDFSIVFPNYHKYFSSCDKLSVFPAGMNAIIKGGGGMSHLIVIDLLGKKISQILSFVDCFWQHQLSIQCSQNGEEIRLVGTLLTNETVYLCAKFNRWYGASLQDLCKRTVRNYYSLRDIKRFNLPSSLLNDFEDGYA